MQDDTRGTAEYWVVVALLCVVGVITIFSIGMPLLVLTVTLAVVAPWRTRRAVLWPAVAAVAAFFVGYLLVAPLSCSTSTSSVQVGPMGPPTPHRSERTTCSSVLGGNPSNGRAVFAGLALSALAAATVRGVLKGRERRRPRPQRQPLVPGG